MKKCDFNKIEAFHNIIGVYVENSNSAIKDIKYIREHPVYKEIKDLGEKYQSAREKQPIKMKLINSIKQMMESDNINAKTMLQTLSLEKKLFESEEITMNNKVFSIVKCYIQT